MITRREVLRLGGGAGVALAGTVAVAASCMPNPAPAAASPELARLIEAHRGAYGALDAYGSIVAEAERAFYQDRADANARQVKDEARDAQNKLLSIEKAAFLALLSYPASTLDELRAIVAIGQRTWWRHDDVSDEEAEALIAGIMGARA